MKAGIIRCMQTEDIAFATGIQKGTPIGYPCHYEKKMKELIQDDLGQEIRVLDYTH